VPQPGPGAEPAGARGLDQPLVDVPDAGVDVEVEREEHAQRDQRDLHGLADADPDDQQRHEREVRQHPGHLDRRVDRVVAEPQQPGGGAQGERERPADQQPDRGPGE
jgi:hypothetical protein